MWMHPLLFPLRACAFDRALVSVAAGVVREREKKPSCASSYVKVVPGT